jgi:hypothetical protein
MQEGFCLKFCTRLNNNIMNYTWNQFFIVVAIATGLYYVAIYVLFFLRKTTSLSNTSISTKSNTNSGFQKNKSKNTKPSNLSMVPIPVNLIDTKVVPPTDHSKENNFVIDETINEDLLHDNDLPNDLPLVADVPLEPLEPIHTAIPYINEHTISQVPTAELQNNTSNNLQGLDELINNSLLHGTENEMATNMVKETVVLEGDIISSTLVPVEQNINIATPENKVQAAPEINLRENNIVTPNNKPKQVQSLMHLVHKK